MLQIHKNSRWIVFLGFAILSMFAPRSIVATDRGVGVFDSLDDVFADVIGDLTSRPFREFQANGPPPAFQTTFTRVVRTGRNHSFEAFPNGVHPNDPGAQTVRVESRITVELYLPTQIDFSDPDSAWMLVWDTPTPIPGEPLPLTTKKRRIFGRKAAERGIPVCLFYEYDLHPIDPDNPVLSIPGQLGYGAGQLVRASTDWLMLKDPAVTPLVVEDFRRLWRHFGLAQNYMISATFAQALIRETFGAESEPWVDSLKLVIGGGSKGVGAVIAAAGVDPRVKAVRFSGSQEFNADPTCAPKRYETDWGECADGQHRRAAFAKWTYDHRNNSPSYFDIHIAEHDPARYRDKLWLDVVGTADWSVPLGTHYAWWDQRDGLVNGVADPSEDRWNCRILRRPNANHGISYAVGQLGNFEITATDLLLWWTMRHLVLGNQLPRCDIVSLTVLDAATWRARVRVTEHTRTLDREEFAVWVLMSDDRDTRRCAPPILSTAGGNCIDGSGFDDNKDIEDFFMRISADSVTANGEFRDITFRAPAEFSQFTQTPMIHAFAELILRGPNSQKIVDDVWVHTEVFTLNRELYPSHVCQ